jgi:flagellar export protein FliJ
MAFQFSLASVLCFRQSVERRQQALLQAANLKVASVRSEIEALERHCGEMASASARDLNAGVSASQLHFTALCQAAVLQRHTQLREELARREEIRVCRSREFEQAWRQREVLERLRDEQFGRYRRRQEQQEQRRTDDLILLRRAFLERG